MADREKQVTAETNLENETSFLGVIKTTSFFIGFLVKQKCGKTQSSIHKLCFLLMYFICSYDATKNTERLGQYVNDCYEDNPG